MTDRRASVQTGGSGAMSLIRSWEAPRSGQVAAGVADFARQLGGPARLRLPGRDPSRCRVRVTLLHGHEPSGLKALHRLLLEDYRPEVDIYCYVLAVEAALEPPLFTRRTASGKRDFNRCFKKPFDLDQQGLVCKTLLDELAALQPEAVVDMHNTSGEGPAFAVTTRYDARHDRLVSLFTDRLIVTDLKLGSIMETSSAALPVVTIECGGAYEESSDRIALDGLRRFFSEPDLYRERERDWGLEILNNPVRIELQEDASLSYGEAPQPRSDLTLKVDIEHHNFGLIAEGTFLGWLTRGREGILNAVDPQKRNHFDEFYVIASDRLYTRVPQKMFMITTNADIAKSDCLWYAVRQ